MDEAIIIEVNENLADTYAEIDAFSQSRSPSFAKHPFLTPRNMGKNDLWIASTAALLGLKLITTDTDFSHLHQIFIEVSYTIVLMLSIKYRYKYFKKMTIVVTS